MLLGFGFTSCPDVCPTTLGTLAQARRELGPAAADVQVVYVTVDPERDDAERMKKYLRGFDPTFVGGTGTPQQLAAVRKDYGVRPRRRPSAKTTRTAHSSFTYLIDRSGRIRALMPYGHSPDDYVHDLKLLLQGVTVRSRSVLLLVLAARRSRRARAGRRSRPSKAASRDQMFEIPKGTWARRMSGDKVDILPDHIRLTLGVRDILVLKNLDDVPQIFGPTLMMPGQSFRLPFEQAAEYQFACTAHASGQMTIVVEPHPATPWAQNPLAHARAVLQAISSHAQTHHDPDHGPNQGNPAVAGRHRRADRHCGGSRSPSRTA